MTQEEKELLLKDLSARLPYGVKARFCDGVKEEIDDIWDIDMFSRAINADYIIDDVQLYLRPMSSMTEEERNEYFDVKMQECERVALAEVYRPEAVSIVFDWLLSHHFDFRGLIEKGLALEAPKDMYNL